MKKRLEMNVVGSKNISTGIYKWWHIISKHPLLTAKQKLLIMEMLRRNEAGCAGTGHDKHGWFFYPSDWTNFMHALVRDHGRVSEDNLHQLTTLEDRVKELRCRSK